MTNTKELPIQTPNMRRYTVQELIGMQTSIPGIELSIKRLQDELRATLEALRQEGIEPRERFLPGSPLPMHHTVVHTIDARDIPPTSIESRVAETISKRHEEERIEAEAVKSRDTVIHLPTPPSNKATKKKRRMSEEGRKAISDAAKARWANMTPRKLAAVKKKSAASRLANKVAK